MKEHHLGRARSSRRETTMEIGVRPIRSRNPWSLHRIKMGFKLRRTIHSLAIRDRLPIAVSEIEGGSAWGLRVAGALPRRVTAPRS